MKTNMIMALGGAILSAGILSAGVLHLEHGWDLISFGGIEKVDINKTLNIVKNGSIVWMYDDVNKSWLAKSNSPDIDSKIEANNIPFADYANKYQGLWVYNAGDAKDINSCQLAPNEKFFEPVADAEVYAYTYRNWDNANSGATGSLFAGYNTVGGEQRTYIRFDLSNIDVASTDKAYLRLLNGAQYYGTDNIDLGVYAVTSAWNEGNGTYHSGVTEPTAPSDQISWNNQPSIDTTLVASFNPSTVGYGNLMRVDITPLVKRWKNGLANYGLVIKPLVLAGDSGGEFGSRENPNPDFRPALIISHECNESNQNNVDKNKPGDVLWTHQVPQNDPAHYIGSSIAIGTDGTLYYEAGGHGDNGTNWDPVQIYAVNKSDGSLKWKSEPLMLWHINSGPMVGDNGNIYVASEFKLYSINPSDGSFNWVWEVPKTLPGENGNDVYTYGELGSMALTNDNDIIIKTTGSGSYYRALYRIGNDGTMKWYRFIGSEATPISIGKNGTIFDYEHANNTGYLTATNPENGSLIWSIPGNALSSNNDIIIASNGDVIAKTSRDTLARINPSNGNTVWEVSPGTSDAKYMDANENIILYSQFTGSYIYNSTNGSLIKGKLPLPHGIAIDSKNQIYGTLSDYNPILSVTNDDGNITWQGKVGQKGFPAISDNNIVYSVIIGGNKILATKTDAGLAHSGWPKFSHDKRNTFNVNKW